MRIRKYFGWTEDDDGEVYGLVDLYVGPVPIAQWRAEGVAQGARAMLVTWDMLPFPAAPSIAARGVLAFVGNAGEPAE